MTGHVVQDGSFLLTKIAVSEHGNDRGVLECVGGRFVLGWWRAWHPGLDAGAVQAKMPTPADSGSGPGMTAGLLHRDCSGYASSARPFDWAQGPEFDGVQGGGG